MANVVDLIARKRDGGSLTAEQWRSLIHGFVRGAVADYQMTAMLMAVRLRGMADEETFDLTDAMATSGAMLDLGSRGAADKHSTGGVGDKVTLVVAPLVAAAGLPIAKMSGRGLAHTGGTVDKLESIRGFRSALTLDQFTDVLDAVGLVIAGQSAELVPADAGMYALRDVTATVDSIPLIAASVMSKKLAVGARSILLDVKAGGGAFMPTAAAARRLARLMVRIGLRAGRRTAAIITEMEEPLGQAVGNALELAEAVAVLSNTGPADLTHLCIEEAAHLLVLGGVRPHRAAKKTAERALQSGAGLEALTRMVAAQGGDPRQIEDTARLPRAPVIQVVRSPRAGVIARVDALAVGMLVMGLGAGRATKTDRIRHDTGVLFHRVHGDHLSTGEPLAEVHAGTPDAAAAAAAALLAAITWSDVSVSPRTLVLGRVRG